MPDILKLRSCAGDGLIFQTVCAGSDVGAPPEGWPKELPHPEPLSPANAKEADDVLELLGPYTAAALYSKTWQLREAGLNQMQAYLQSLVGIISI